MRPTGCPSVTVRVDLEHVAAEVARLRVVALVQADRLRVVVDGDVDVRPADGLLDAGGGAAPACEQVDDQLAVRDGV
jgi:hypothetical protein